MIQNYFTPIQNKQKQKSNSLNHKFAYITVTTSKTSHPPVY